MLLLSFLFIYLFGSLMSLHISLYLYQKFLSISSPLHHHNRRPSCLSPPRSFDYVAFFTTIFTVTLVTITTDLRTEQ
ncbi:hypothetical protein BRARA_G00605 [Brassica rapa]|uniref:Uncharacterized protein n=1 Tax=Brassica campestris TaxID=3711 RepID=A0A397YK56_BRACM|nr:hypothetical protein BRARA_G00605 [Brassica rapa]